MDLIEVVAQPSINWDSPGLGLAGVMCGATLILIGWAVIRHGRKR